MSKITLSTVSSGFLSNTTMSTNFTSIANEFQNKVLYRDNPTGEPNSMQQDLDMNGHRILNTLAQSGDGFIWKGNWTAATSYSLNNLVSITSGTYTGYTMIATQNLTSLSTFDLDFATGKWDIVAARGAAGAGTGDMLKSENLLGLTNVATARTNLGVLLPPFVDTNPIIQGSIDATKQIRFEVDGITTATTRVITVPDKDGTLAMTSDLTSNISKLPSFTAVPSSGVLAISIVAGVLDFRNASLTNGTPQSISFGANTLNIPVGATLGAPAAITSASATMSGTTTLTLVAAPSAPVQVGAIIFQGGTRIGKVTSLGTYVGGTGTGTIILDTSATFTAQAIVIINPARLLVLLMANGELAAMNQSGGLPFDGSKLINTTAISAGATANNVIYSTTARTNQPYRLIGIIDVANATVGTYTTPELLYATSGSEFAAAIAIGNGQTWQDVTTQRVNGLTYRNIEGRPIKESAAFSISSAGTASAVINGVTITGTSFSTAGTGVATITIEIPAGASYVFNSTAITGTSSWTSLK